MLNTKSKVILVILASIAFFVICHANIVLHIRLGVQPVTYAIMLVVLCVVIQIIISTEYFRNMGTERTIGKIIMIFIVFTINSIFIYYSKAVFREYIAQIYTIIFMIPQLILTSYIIKVVLVLWIENKYHNMSIYLAPFILISLMQLISGVLTKKIELNLIWAKVYYLNNTERTIDKAIGNNRITECYNIDKLYYLDEYTSYHYQGDKSISVGRRLADRLYCMTATMSIQKKDIKYCNLQNIEDVKDEAFFKDETTNQIYTDVVKERCEKYYHLKK